MIITRLGIRNVRNLVAVDLEPGEGLNLVTGVNGAGKTSLLEAIHLLANGHSFRTRHVEELRRHESECLQVMARVRAQGGGPSVPVGIERSADTARRRLGGRDVGSQAELARQLPVQAFHPESHRLVSGGPRERRQFIDWGVFHVEHGFLEAWRRYQRAVRQRNAALKRGDGAMAHAFDEELVAMGEEVTGCRQRYVELLAHELPDIQSRLFPEHAVRLRLRRGWPEERDLMDALEGDRERDLRDGYTHLGPHRADLDLRIEGRPVSEVASRGQQKAVVAGLVLLQAQIYGDRVGRTCIVLVDDLPSELDVTHRAAVLDLLRGMRVQVFVTAIEAEQVDLSRWDRAALFHVEQGSLRELI